MSDICHPDIEYWQPHIGAYIGRHEFVEYAYTLAPQFNGGAFMHSPIEIVRFESRGDDGHHNDWVLNYTWRTAAGFAGETLEDAEKEHTILRLGFSDEPGNAHPRPRRNLPSRTTGLHGISTSWPRRRCDPPPRKAHHGLKPRRYELTYTEFSRPTYEFMSRISMTPTRLCSGALAYCPGELFPYASMDACISYLSEDVASACLDGAGGDFSGNTRACRQMHLQLALLDPIVHCPASASRNSRSAGPRDESRRRRGAPRG